MYIVGDGDGLIDISGKYKNFLSDMSMHFSQLKSMKNLVAASNVDKGR